RAPPPHGPRRCDRRHFRRAPRLPVHRSDGARVPARGGAWDGGGARGPAPRSRLALSRGGGAPGPGGRGGRLHHLLDAAERPANRSRARAPAADRHRRPAARRADAVRRDRRPRRGTQRGGTSAGAGARARGRAVLRDDARSRQSPRARSDRRADPGLRGGPRRCVGPGARPVCRPNAPEPAREATLELLRLPSPPTAILAMSDILAIGALEAAAELEIRVPEQLSVVGFDDGPTAEHAAPPLTTVAQPNEEKGRLAAQWLM